MTDPRSSAPSHPPSNPPSGPPQNLPLFRAEVLAAQNAQWLGSIRIGRPLGFSLVTGAALVMAAALLERLRSLQADSEHLQAELEGVRQRVSLARHTAKNFESLAAQGFVPLLQAQQRQEELLEMSQRERSAQRQLQAAKREQASVLAEARLAQTQLEATQAQLERQRATLAQERSELAARSQWTLTAPQAGTVAAVNATPGQAATAGLTLVALLPAGEEAGGRSVAGAGAAGGAGGAGVAVGAGDAVAGSTAPLTAPLTAHLYAPSRTTGFIQPGQPVWLSYDAYPYQKFGQHAARVQSVSRTPVNPQNLPAGRAQALMQAAQTSEPLYRVSVQLQQQSIRAYGQKQALKSGMALQAHVALDKRAIWEWVLEPVLALKAPA